MVTLKRAKYSHNQNLLLAQGGLNFLGGLMGALMWARSGSPHLDWVFILLPLSGILLLFWVLARRSSFSDLGASLVFGAALVPVYGMLWASQEVLAAQGSNWVAFEPHELSCLTIAILAPPIRRVGVLAIVLILALAILQHATFSAEQIAHLPTRPLFAPIAFSIFAVVLYLFRVRGLRITDFAAQKGAEAEMMRNLSRTLLAVKDLANSPIQALTLDAEILKRTHAKDYPVASRIEKSATQLRDLNRILDEQLRTEMSDSMYACFDPHEELESIRSAFSRARDARNVR